MLPVCCPPPGAATSTNTDPYSRIWPGVWNAAAGRGAAVLTMVVHIVSGPTGAASLMGTTT